MSLYLEVWLLLVGLRGLPFARFRFLSDGFACEGHSYTLFALLPESVFFTERWQGLLPFECESFGLSIRFRLLMAQSYCLLDFGGLLCHSHCCSPLNGFPRLTLLPCQFCLVFFFLSLCLLDLSFD